MVGSVFVMAGLWLSLLSDSQRMHLYSFCTPSHEILKDTWFLPSIKDDFEVDILFERQDCRSGVFLDAGWKKTTKKKIQNVIQACTMHEDQLFVYADIDIQFFKPIGPMVEELMEGYDILFQKDSPTGTACSGFFMCRASHEVLLFWKNVYKYMKLKNCSDQEAVNTILKGSGAKIKWGLLPVSFFGGGTLTGTLWVPGTEFEIPDDIVLHHANWTKGVENKCAQLAYVREVVEKRQRPEH